MALVACKACGKTISGKAKSCPWCGYVYRTNVSTWKALQGWCANMSTWKVVGIFAFIFFVAVVYSSLKEQTPVEESRKERIEKQFGVWDGSHYTLTRFIKDAMNDPKSYEHVETIYIDKGDYLKVKTTYRGKNAFGGVVKNWIWAKVDLEGNVIEIITQGP